jgi:hypothetical protein
MQPDVAVRVRGSYWPTLVVESGWSEEYDDLVEDARMWLVGGRLRCTIDNSTGQLHVNAVILVHFDHKDFDADSSQPITLHTAMIFTALTIYENLLCKQEECKRILCPCISYAKFQI